MKTLPLLSVLLPATSSSTAGRLTIDETLEGRARRGDRKALEALLREHARTIHDVCRYIVGFDDAHDATQEALERIVTAIHQYDPAKGAFRTWALTVTRNLCRDRLRRRGLERRYDAWLLAIARQRELNEKNLQTGQIQDDDENVCPMAPDPDYLFWYEYK